MQRLSLSRAFSALSLLLLAWGAPAQGTANQGHSLGDLSTFRTIAADTLAIVNTGNLTRAKARIKDLETTWDEAEAKLRPRNPERWQNIDKAIDAALGQLRADKPQASGAKDALQSLLATLDQSATVSPREAAAVESARLSVIDIIAAAEKLQVGAIVL